MNILIRLRTAFRQFRETLPDPKGQLLTPNDSGPPAHLVRKERINPLFLEEVRLLDLATGARTPPECDLVILDSRVAVWRIQIPSQPDRYMSAHAVNFGSLAFVVQVDADKFYRTWLASTCEKDIPSLSDCKLREDMPSDYKYAEAVRGFSHGQSNPVPLAEVRIMYYDMQVRLAFINGITRSFWLLANRAPSFVVKVYGKESAFLMHQMVGIGSGPVSYDSLFNSEKQIVNNL